MKIASFDVGIKNLAICIFDISNNGFHIDAWNVINLANEDTCSQCNENAKFSKNTVHFCHKHAKKSDYKIPPVNLVTIDKKTKKDLLVICNDNQITIPSSKTLKSELLTIIKSNYKTNFLTQIERINANSINLVDIGTSLKQNLDGLNYYVNKVIIENQIGPLANRMKCIQAMITQYFIDNKIVDIEYISASNKLAAFMSGPSEYKDRKKHSIMITRSLIKDKKWLDFFNQHKKKDDLGDCFLQGVWYLRKNNLIVNCGDT